MKKEYKTTCPTLRIEADKSDFKRVKISTSNDSYNFIKEFYGSDIRIVESFYLLLLNRANITTGFVKISQGGTASTIVDIKLIAKYAVDSLCSAVILAHNHPSGNIEASDADIKMTERVKKALELFEIRTLDHIILADDGTFTSLADSGLM